MAAKRLLWEGMGMTIKKRLAQSNIAMLVIPLLTAAVLLASVVLTDLYLTRSLFRHISRPLDILTAAWLYRSAVNAGMNKSLWMILGLAGNVLAVAAFLIVRDAP